LCSDGLTTMIKEDRIAAILDEAATLDEAVTRLVAEANQAGGRDNITVVAFRVDEAAVPAEADDQLTLVGPAAEQQERPRTREEVAAARSAGRPRRERRWPRRAVTALVTIVVTVGLAALAVWGARQIYFLGTDSGGRLALYRGLPYDLPLGIDLYSEVYAAPVQVNSVPAGRRDSATDHTLRFHDDAVSLLDDLQAAAERRTGREQAAISRQEAGGGKQQSGGGQGGKAGGGGSSTGGGSGGGGSGNKGGGG
ncbi:MAG TPA: hypothetical protein VKA47_13855, partial [Solirubrobacterales bacterium]|nr:hypothetical protein [Solirubrobacterales bacterium]